MLFHGPFEVLDFSEILLLLATKAETGRLEVRATGTTAKLYLSSGRLTWAEVEDRPPTIPPGTGADDQLVEACARYVHCERGTFEFEPGAKSPLASETGVDVERTLALAEARANEWRQITAVVPSLEAHPSLVPEVTTEPVILSRDLWRLVAAIDGRRSVHALARVTGMSAYAVCRLLKQLVEAGVVEVGVQPKVTIEAWRVDVADDNQSVEEGVVVEEEVVKVTVQPKATIGASQLDEANGNQSGRRQFPEEREQSKPVPGTGVEDESDDATRTARPRRPAPEKG